MKHKISKNRSVTGAALAVLCLSFASCSNLFHDLVPKPGCEILEFYVNGQLSGAVISGDSVYVEMPLNSPLNEIVPRVHASDGATVFPLTLSYIREAFPSAVMPDDALDFMTTDNIAKYVIDLIMRFPDFNVPPIYMPIDYSGGSVEFLIIGAAGDMKRWKTTVEETRNVGRFETFMISKLQNPEVIMDSVAEIDNVERTVNVKVYVAENFHLPVFLIPTFEINGRGLLKGLPPAPFISMEHTLYNENEITGKEPRHIVGEILEDETDKNIYNTELTIEHDSGNRDYTVSIHFEEYPDTGRNIIDYRFDKSDGGENINLVNTARGVINNSGNIGDIYISAYYRGDIKPVNLIPRIVATGVVYKYGTYPDSNDGSPASAISVEDAENATLVYRVDSIYGIRNYTIHLELLSMSELVPIITTFGFDAAQNSGISKNIEAKIEQKGENDEGIILVNAIYLGDNPPTSLVPQFNARGEVRVNSSVQTSGLNAHDFRQRVNYTVVNTELNLQKKYRVETTWTADTSSACTITQFTFDTDKNTNLQTQVKGVINQLTGDITLYARPGSNSLSTMGRTVLMTPRFTAMGNVRVVGVTQISGESGQHFYEDTHIEYIVTSENGEYSKIYKVKLSEVGTTIYVKWDATGANNGTSWANAFNYIEDACVAADELYTRVNDAAKEVWIARGEYKLKSEPYMNITPLTSYLGGFAGNEINKDNRNPAVNITRVVGRSAVEPNLFRGDAVATGDVEFASLVFSNAANAIKFKRQQSLQESELVIENCTFDNFAQSSVDVENFGDIILKNGNSSGQAGSGGRVALKNMDNEGIIEVTDFIFKDTRTEGSNGGALYIDNYASSKTATLQHISVQNSESVSYPGTGGGGAKGGAIYVHAKDTLLNDIKIDNARSSVEGGALYIHSDSLKIQKNNNDLPSIYITNVGEDNAPDGGLMRIITKEGTNQITMASVPNESATGAAEYVFSKDIIIDYSDATHSIPQDVPSGIHITAENDAAVDVELINMKRAGNAVIKRTSGVQGGNTTLRNITIPATSSLAVTPIYITGGVDISDCVITGKDILVTENDGNGGGIFVDSSGRDVSIRDTTVTHTQAARRGGGIYVKGRGSVAVELTNITISNTNTTVTGGSEYDEYQRKVAEAGLPGKTNAYNSAVDAEAVAQAAYSEKEGDYLEAFQRKTIAEDEYNEVATKLAARESLSLKVSGAASAINSKITAYNIVRDTGTEAAKTAALLDLWNAIAAALALNPNENPTSAEVDATGSNEIRTKAEAAYTALVGAGLTDKDDLVYSNGNLKSELAADLRALNALTDTITTSIAAATNERSAKDTARGAANAAFTTAETALTVSNNALLAAKAVSASAEAAMDAAQKAVNVAEEEYTSNADTGGGALWVEAAGNVDAKNIVLSDASSATNGGALYLKNSSTDSGDHTYFYDVKITNANAAGSGGGAFIQARGAGPFKLETDSFPKIEFTNTYATTGSGGAIYIATAGGGGTLKGITTNTTSAGASGGAIYVNSTSAAGTGLGNVEVNGLVMEHSSAVSQGGAMYMNTQANTTISNFKVDDAKSIGYGGGMYINSGATLTISGTSGSHSTMHNARSTGGEGGGFWIYGTTVKMEWVDIGKLSGGGRHNWSDWSGDDATMTSRYDGYSLGGRGGGAICIASNGGNINLANMNINNTYAANRGGGIMIWQSGKTNFNNVLVENCTTSWSGGGMHLEVNVINMQNTKVRNCLAADGGGLHYWGCATSTESSVIGAGVEVYNNYAYTSGGGIQTHYAYGPTHIQINSGAVIYNNESRSHGGGIFVAGGSSRIVIQGGVIKNNKSGGEGGGIYLASGVPADIIHIRPGTGAPTALYGAQTISFVSTGIPSTTNFPSEDSSLRNESSSPATYAFGGVVRSYMSLDYNKMNSVATYTRNTLLVELYKIINQNYVKVYFTNE